MPCAAQSSISIKQTNFCASLSLSIDRALVLSNLSNKNDSMGLGGMLPRKHFENFHTVMADLVLFKQFSGKVSSYF